MTTTTRRRDVRGTVGPPPPPARQPASLSAVSRGRGSAATGGAASGSPADVTTAEPRERARPPSGPHVRHRGGRDGYCLTSRLVNRHVGSPLDPAVDGVLQTTFSPPSRDVRPASVSGDMLPVITRRVPTGTRSGLARMAFAECDSGTPRRSRNKTLRLAALREFAFSATPLRTRAFATRDEKP